MNEPEKRALAMRIQAEMMGRTGPGAVTSAGRTGPGGVISAEMPFKTTADGRAGRRGSADEGKKIAKIPAAPAPPEAGPARTKPNRRENEFMLNLMILRNSLRINAPACRERARTAGKWVWRDIRLMLTLVDRIQRQLLDTMPESRDDYYSAYARHGHYELHIDGPVRTARHLLVTDRHLAAMAEAAMRSECILCMREGSEIDRCPLREALLESAVPSDVQEGDSLLRKCEYRDAAGQLIHGKDVTI